MLLGLDCYLSLDNTSTNWSNNFCDQVEISHSPLRGRWRIKQPLQWTWWWESAWPQLSQCWCWRRWWWPANRWRRSTEESSYAHNTPYLNNTLSLIILDNSDIGFLRLIPKYLETIVRSCELLIYAVPKAWCRLLQKIYILTLQPETPLNPTSQPSMPLSQHIDTFLKSWMSGYSVELKRVFSYIESYSIDFLPKNNSGMILFGSAGCCVCGVQNSLIKMEVVESLVLDKLCVCLKGVSPGVVVAQEV